MAPNEDVEELEVQAIADPPEAVTPDHGSPADDPSQSDAATESSSDDGEPSELPPSRLTLRRKHRNRLVAIASVLSIVFVLVVLWGRGAFSLNTPKQEEIPTIAPDVLFEQICGEIQQENRSALHVTDFEVTDAMIPQVGALTQLTTVVIDGGAVSDAAMTTMADLPALEHLRLRLSPITDEGLKEISRSKSLLFLNLPHSEVTAAGIAQLKQIPKLRMLRLGSPKLGNEVTREIAALPALRTIHLIGVPVTDEGLKTLAEMPYLESLYLDDSAVTESGWEWLFREHPQLHIHINQAHHDRDPRAHEHH